MVSSPVRFLRFCRLLLRARFHGSLLAPRCCGSRQQEPHPPLQARHSFSRLACTCTGSQPHGLAGAHGPWCKVVNASLNPPPEGRGQWSWAHGCRASLPLLQGHPHLVQQLNYHPPCGKACPCSSAPAVGWLLARGLAWCVVVIIQNTYVTVHARGLGHHPATAENKVRTGPNHGTWSLSTTFQHLSPVEDDVIKKSTAEPCQPPPRC